MNAVTLIIIACLRSDPSSCQDHPMPFDGPMMACAILGQQALPGWEAAHPKWQAKRWKCRPADAGRSA